MAQTHFIERQKLDFEFTSEEKAKEWNKTTTTFYNEQILPVLQTLFDKHAPSDQWYSIPSLEIDLGNIYSRDIKNVLSQKIEAELLSLFEKKEIYHALSDIADDVPAPTKVFEVKTPNQKLLETFYNFLEHGILLWNRQINTTELLEQEIMGQIGAVTLTAIPEFRQRIKLQVVRERLFYQFTKPFWNKILVGMFSKELNVLRAFKNSILKNLEFSSLDAQSKREIKSIVSGDVTSWIISVGSNEQETWTETIIFSLFEKMTAKHHGNDQIFEFIEGLTHLDESDRTIGSQPEAIKSVTSYSKTFITLRRRGKPTHLPLNILNKDDQAIENQKISSESGALQKSIDRSDSSGATSKPTVGTSPKDTEKAARTNTPENSNFGTPDYSHPFSGKRKTDTVTQPSKSSKEQSKTSTPKALTRQGADRVIKDQLITSTNDTREAPVANALKEYFVLNAGIILCWPYLTQLFKRTQYLADKTFKGEKHQERAVHLLGYVAGFQKGDEHRLTIAKLLTNWPLPKPVIKKLKLTSKEKQEADDMLSNMILNWPILKNTSIDGLQTSFFHRDGKLKKEEQGWKLIVEQKSYDMLLDHLPYSIAMIKLPWMDEVLKVDWA